MDSAINSQLIKKDDEFETNPASKSLCLMVLASLTQIQLERNEHSKITVENCVVKKLVAYGSLEV